MLQTMSIVVNMIDYKSLKKFLGKSILLFLVMFKTQIMYSHCKDATSLLATVGLFHQAHLIRTLKYRSLQ